jgi:DNA-binding response OmpR family regulator
MDTNKRILMIEDDREMVALARLILEREGYQVLAAYDGVEGLQVLRQENGNVDVLLLDLMMRGKDGWQVLAELKSDERLCRVPVILLTARPSEDESSNADLHAGQFEHYVVKPFDVRDLLAKIGQVVDR